MDGSEEAGRGNLLVTCIFKSWRKYAFSISKRSRTNAKLINFLLIAFFAVNCFWTVGGVGSDYIFAAFFAIATPKFKRVSGFSAFPITAVGADIWQGQTVFFIKIQLFFSYAESGSALMLAFASMQTADDFNYDPVLYIID